MRQRAWSPFYLCGWPFLGALSGFIAECACSEVDRIRKLVGSPPLPVEPSNDQLALELAAKMQHQEILRKQVGVLQQRVVDAETKLLKQKELLGETEREELDGSLVALRKLVWPSPRVSPRQQSVDEEMFSAKEDQESESGDDPTRGLGRWFKVVKPKKIGGLKNL